MQKLTAQQKREFKGKLHSLNPVVIIGHAGVTPGVLAEIENALDAHELIKIRVSGVDRDMLKEVAKEICKTTGAEIVHSIGFIIAIYRKSEDDG